jgi:hypothetical protein
MDLMAILRDIMVKAYTQISDVLVTVAKRYSRPRGGSKPKV